MKEEGGYKEERVIRRLLVFRWEFLGGLEIFGVGRKEGRESCC